MTRRARALLLVSLSALLVRAPFALGAEVAVLKSSETAAWRPALEAFRRAAGEHSVSELDLRGDRAAAEGLIAGLKGKAAAIVAMGALAAQAARELAPEIPLVVCMVPDPARIGIEPAPGVSGVAFQPPIRNQLAAFRAVNPRGVNIGVLYNPENSGRLVEQAQRAAPVVRLRILEKAVATEKDVPQALRALLAGPVPVDALWLPPDPVLLADEARRFLLSEMLKAGKPVYGFSAALVQEGALVSNGADFVSVGEEAAELLKRLLGPEKDARVEFAFPRAELAINQKTAARLKIEVPPDLLKAAAKVY